MHRWTRLSSKKWEDAWVERLRFLGPQVTFMTWPNSRALKIEAYCDKKTAHQLVKNFAGQTAELPSHVWNGHRAKPCAPLNVRSKLKVFSDETSYNASNTADLKKKAKSIIVPHGMAFGTGEHATTATCLRLLCDLVPLLPTPWRAMDLGTGTGILAIAAGALGASSVYAVDYDPNAVRIAKQNVKKNKSQGITVKRANVLKDNFPKNYDLVTANLYSELLMGSLGIIMASLKNNGWLIFSGVLCNQAPEVVRALASIGFSQPQIVARGKWCAGITRKIRVDAQEALPLISPTTLKRPTRHRRKIE